MDALIEKNRHGYLLHYPYKETHGQYRIHKKMQNKQLTAEFFNPKSCYEAPRNEIIYRVMNWLGVLAAVAAIIVTLGKELDEGRVSEIVILRLSVTELLLAMISIIISLSKHMIRYDDLVLLQKNIIVEGKENTKSMTNRKKLKITLGVIMVVFILVLLIGFIAMHVKDDDTHQYLTYTKFTTTLTLFLSILLDSLINDFLTDAFNVAKLDQCKMVIHQLKVELKASMHDTRYKQLEDFLNNHKVFTVSNSDHIQFQEAQTELQQQEKNHNGQDNMKSVRETNEKRAENIPNTGDFSEML